MLCLFTDEPELDGCEFGPSIVTAFVETVVPLPLRKPPLGILTAFASEIISESLDAVSLRIANVSLFVCTLKFLGTPCA